ncbi:MAG TPA: hypothetical protein VJZ00_24075 [Thermoanaerobaculia bacterium]|nr:hypothetical protein [Thermoanaerobaculia bacterium]
MTTRDLLARIVAALNAAEVPYMLTGSYASSLHSIPRATKDIDIIIFPNRDQLTRFIELLPADAYYTDLEDAMDALRHRGQFNVIDHATGWKVDFILPAFDEFHVEEFARRRDLDAEGLTVSVVSPEDIILAKLAWAKAGRSERQIEDAVTVLRVQRPTLDFAYLERWVRKLGLETQWNAALAQSQ